MTSWTSERARVASLTRSRDPKDPDLLEARRNLRAARLEDYIARTVNELPALSAEQLSRLAGLLLRGEAPPGLTASRRPAGSKQTVTGSTSVKTTSVTHVQGAA